jgi:hypothetical protein
MVEFTDPQHIVDMIDNEGWPDALQWLVGDKFEDKDLNQLIYDCYEIYTLLQGHERILMNKLKSMGVDVYI